MSLPPPSPNQPYCDVSALNAGSLHMHLAQLVDDAADDTMTVLPALAFLLRHSRTHQNILFDLGIRHDLSNIPTGPLELCAALEITPSGRDLAAALEDGGLAPHAVDRIFLSHVHFDHTGNPKQFPNAEIVLGAGAHALIERGAPHFAGTFVGIDLPERGATFVDPETECWPALGPFPRARDWYGDGSVYVVDAPGHIQGHVNLLVRTSADGGWLFLAGDSAHDRRLLSGEAGIACHPRFGCAHEDVEEAQEHMRRINRLGEENPRVQVVLAHDGPWADANRDEGVYWPGKIASL